MTRTRKIPRARKKKRFSLSGPSEIKWAKEPVELRLPIDPEVLTRLEREFPNDSVTGERATMYPRVNISALARELGVPRAHMWRIMHGRVMPRAALVRRIAERIGVSMESVMGWLEKIK